MKKKVSRKNNNKKKSNIKRVNKYNITYDANFHGVKRNVMGVQLEGFDNTHTHSIGLFAKDVNEAVDLLNEIAKYQSVDGFLIVTNSPKKIVRRKVNTNDRKVLNEVSKKHPGKSIKDTQRMYFKNARY